MLLLRIGCRVDVRLWQASIPPPLRAARSGAAMAVVGTKDECKCKGKVTGTGTGDNRPLTADQLRLPEAPEPRKRIIVDDDDDSD